MYPGKIISGGQTGADRAALDAALACGVAPGGWCPRGRRAEDGPINPRYGLRETPSEAYAERTAWNVRDSDGTLVFTWGAAAGGTALTIEEARRRGRSLLVVDLTKETDPAGIRRWIVQQRIRVLNVAGPRASEAPAIYDAVFEVMRAVLDSKPEGEHRIP